MWMFLWQFGWPPCQPQLQSRAAFGGTLQGYGMTVILKPQTKDKAHTAAHHFLLRAAVSINNMGIPCAHGSRGNWCSLRTTLPFPKVTHILYKDFKRLKHKEETEIILIVSLERTTVNILFFFFWLRWVFVAARELLSSCSAQASHGSGSSCWGARQLGSRACRLQQLWCSDLFVPQHVEPSQVRNWTYVPFIDRQMLNHWTTREVHHLYLYVYLYCLFIFCLLFWPRNMACRIPVPWWWCWWWFSH